MADDLKGDLKKPEKMQMKRSVKEWFLGDYDWGARGGRELACLGCAS